MLTRTVATTVAIQNVAGALGIGLAGGRALRFLLKQTHNALILAPLHMNNPEEAGDVPPW